MKNVLLLLTLSASLVAVQGCSRLGVTPALGDERRSTGFVVEDRTIESKCVDQIREHFGANTRVSVTSYNLSVLIVGQAPDEASKAKVESLVKAVPNVRNVYNHMSVRAVLPQANRNNDIFVTGRLKARLTEEKKVNANQIKVVTEAGVVYLMGIVYHAEADIASDVASKVPDVNRVVRLFEYLD